MKQLGIIDSAFINMEQPTIPQHVGGLGIYDPSTAPGKFVRFKDVLAGFERRLQRMPIFRTRLVEVPFGLDRPYWVLDPAFDVEFHIRHIALPSPGDWRQLCIQVARLHSRPLDMSRPLWEAYIIEGLDRIPQLPKGSFAIYTKMHHSLIDGAGGQNFMAAIHDLEPVPSHANDTDMEFSPQFPDIQPTDVRLLGKALLNLVPDSLGKMRSVARLVADLGRVGVRVAREQMPAPQMVGPKTRFDEPVGPNRVFEAAMFDLDEIKAMKDAAGLTVNDLAVSIVAGALRAYLLAHNELPEESLIAAMPVNMRTRVGDTGDNNQVGAIYGQIHTDIADPVERMHAIKKSLDDAKAIIDTPLVSFSQVMGFFPPIISKPVARLYVRNKLTRQLPLGVATVITNVMGPPFPVYCAGAKMVNYLPLGLLNPGLGCFHSVFSCAGKVTFGILADRAQMPDPEFYRQCLVSSYAELHAALLGRGSRRATAGRKRADRAKTRRVRKSGAAAQKTPARGRRRA